MQNSPAGCTSIASRRWDISPKFCRRSIAALRSTTRIEEILTALIHIKKRKDIWRRKQMKRQIGNSLAAAAVFASAMSTLAITAAADDIVIGASLPLSGPLA